MEKYINARRWVARTIDNLLFGCTAIFLFAFLSRLMFGWEYQYEKFHQMGWLFLYSFVEPFILVRFGNTIGKHLLGIKIVDSGQTELNYSRYLKRCLLLYLKGLGFGFPLAAIILMLIARHRVLKGEKTSWDTACQTNVVLHSKSVKPTTQKEQSL